MVGRGDGGTRAGEPAMPVPLAAPLSCCCHPWLSPTGGSGAAGCGHCLNTQVDVVGPLALSWEEEEEVSGSFAPSRERAVPHKCQRSSTQPGVMEAAEGGTQGQDTAGEVWGCWEGSSGTPCSCARGRACGSAGLAAAAGAGGARAGLSTRSSPELSALCSPDCPGGRPSGSSPWQGAGLMVGTAGTLCAARGAQGW